MTAPDLSRLVGEARRLAELNYTEGWNGNDYDEATPATGTAPGPSADRCPHVYSDGQRCPSNVPCPFSGHDKALTSAASAERCESCKGYGKILGDGVLTSPEWLHTCPACHGTGAMSPADCPMCELRAEFTELQRKSAEPQPPAMGQREHADKLLTEAYFISDDMTPTEAAARLCEAMAAELAKEPEPDIERVQALLRDCASAIRSAPEPSVTSGIDAAASEFATLRARVDELEAALLTIANDPHQSYDQSGEGQYGIGVADGHRCAAMKARALLEGK